MSRALKSFREPFPLILMTNFNAVFIDLNSIFMVYQQGTRAVTFQPISPLSTRFTISMDIHRWNSLKGVIPMVSWGTVLILDPRLEEEISDYPATPSTTMSHTPIVDTRTPLPLDTRMPTAHFLLVAFGFLLPTLKYSMKSYLKDFVTAMAFRICISRQLTDALIFLCTHAQFFFSITAIHF